MSDIVIERWIRCTALARIVHGDSHWMLAKTHIQLAKAYQQWNGLHQQALMHATKGWDILLSPSGHMTNPSCDQEPESVYQLALAHCVIGKALTHLDRYMFVLYLLQAIGAYLSIVFAGYLRLKGHWLKLRGVQRSTARWPTVEEQMWIWIWI